MDEMPEGEKWDGFPVFGRDRDGWHLLNYDEAEHPIPMWWCWHIEAWKADPADLFSAGAPNAAYIGYSYLAGTVTPAALKEAIAEAVAAERERLVSEVVGRIDRFKITRDPDDLMQDAACKAIVEAIRSAAK
ncbi:hypothetical protein AD929_15845 [Gluconobacter potus]|uniref:Uncharacterized protein n=2 Tax=Gluconobacter potus TaxID=2724927 RepID=A0A149QPL8_9PROT|nr:hypothetical protein AD929_15845 [Gluconobacter potus]